MAGIEIPALQVGERVELSVAHPTRRQLRPGALGTIIAMPGYWGLVEVLFDNDPRPAFVSGDRLRPFQAEQ